MSEGEGGVRRFEPGSRIDPQWWRGHIDPGHRQQGVRCHEGFHALVSEATGSPVVDIHARYEPETGKGGEVRRQDGPPQIQAVNALGATALEIRFLQSLGYDDPDLLSNVYESSVGHDREHVFQRLAAGQPIDLDQAAADSRALAARPDVQDAVASIADMLADRGDRMDRADFLAALPEGFVLEPGRDLWVPDHTEEELLRRRAAELITRENAWRAGVGVDPVAVWLHPEVPQQRHNERAQQEHGAQLPRTEPTHDTTSGAQRTRKEKGMPEPLEPEPERETTTPAPEVDPKGPSALVYDTDDWDAEAYGTDTSLTWDDIEVSDTARVGLTQYTRGVIKGTDHEAVWVEYGELGTTEQVISQNELGADAVSAVWDRLTGPDAPTDTDAQVWHQDTAVREQQAAQMQVMAPYEAALGDAPSPGPLDDAPEAMRLQLADALDTGAEHQEQTGPGTDTSLTRAVDSAGRIRELLGGRDDAEQAPAVEPFTEAIPDIAPDIEPPTPC